MNFCKLAIVQLPAHSDSSQLEIGGDNPCSRHLSGKYDAKRGDHFLQADFTGLIYISFPGILSSCRSFVQDGPGWLDSRIPVANTRLRPNRPNLPLLFAQEHIRFQQFSSARVGGTGQRNQLGVPLPCSLAITKHLRSLCCAV